MVAVRPIPMQRYFQVLAVPAPVSVGLLVARVVMGTALVLRAVPKIQDPLGWATGGPLPTWALAIAAFAEFVGGLLLVLGLASPAAALLIVGVMSGAIYYHVDLGQPFVSRSGGPSFELAAIDLAVAVLVLLAGPGQLSADSVLFGRRRD